MKMQAAVFFGGRSVEHEVSIITAMQAIAALDKEKYDAVPIYVAKDGSLYTGNHYDRLETFRKLPSALEAGRQVTLMRQGGRVILANSAKKLFGSDKPVYLDVALLSVHGTFAEDGCLQGMLDLVGLPYTGCDVLSSAVCMDKPSAKALLRVADLPVLEDAVLDSSRYANNPEVVLSAIETRYPYPVMVKPANLGSSVGISKVDSRAGLAAALDLAFTFSSRVLIEPALIHMRELNCAVIGDIEKARPSVCEEPIAHDEFLSYKDKYLQGNKQGMSGQKRVIPADITPDKAELAQKLAVSAFRALGCSGVVRVDLLWDTLHDQFYINEVNTIPGSLAYYLWEASGLGFTAMLDEMIELAFTRARRRAQLTFTYDTNILSDIKLGGAKS